MVTITCKRRGCKCTKQVRQADINRGWGLFCSKRCKAIDQTQRNTVRPQKVHVRQQQPSTKTVDYVNRAAMIDAYEEAYCRFYNLPVVRR